MRLVATAQVLKLINIILIFAGVMGMLVSPVGAQNQKSSDGSAVSDDDRQTKLAEQINVRPASHDAEIDKRLTGILQATGWFSDVRVQVEQGIVFLDGKTTTEEKSAWAGKLAGKIVDVVAVVNRIQVIERSPWDIAPMVNELRVLWKKVLQGLPKNRVGSGVSFLCLAPCQTFDPQFR